MRWRGLALRTLGHRSRPRPRAFWNRHEEADMRTRTTVLILTLILSPAMLQRPAAQGPLNDAEVMALFDEANTTDIWLARLALGRAQSTDVHRLADMVVADHEGVQ